MILRKNVDHKNEDNAQTRRVFDWFKNLFGIKNNADDKSVKNVNRTGIEFKIEKTEENILESINRIADAMEKISSSVDIQLHMMVPIDKNFEISTHHDNTRERNRRIRNANKTEDVLESNVTEKLTTLDYLEPIYRMASTIEKINNNMELQLHLMLAKKDRGKTLNKHDAVNSRRSTFEWMYNIIFGKNKSNHPSSVKGNTTLYDLLTRPIDENTEGDILEAMDRIGFALERINTNLELQIHMKLDCNCEDRSRYKRKYDIYKRPTRMDRDFYEIVTNMDDNKPLKDGSIRRKRNSETDSEVTTETSENSRSDEVKMKLLGYIYENYNDITDKIDPLSKVKARFQDEHLYKIGYIMSNVDTLEVNLKNMKKEVDTNKKEFDDAKILSILDTFMASNRIVQSLIKSLKDVGKPETLSEAHDILLEKPLDIMSFQNTQVLPIN